MYVYGVSEMSVEFWNYIVNENIKRYSIARRLKESISLENVVNIIGHGRWTILNENHPQECSLYFNNDHNHTSTVFLPVMWHKSGFRI